MNQERVNLKQLESITNILYHRGPDDKGYLVADINMKKAFQSNKLEDLMHFWEEYNSNLALGHRRLSIIDLSADGRQPMCNEDGMVWIVHNGEIYNYIEIKNELESFGHRFISKTDTETIIHAYEEWGIDCLNHFNGMWSFAIIDLKRGRIFCSRDRAGIKPFYYLFDGKRFYFSSEIKTFFIADLFLKEPNNQIIADYLFSGLIDHTNETFFKNVYQLRGGNYLILEKGQIFIRQYWDISPKKIYSPNKADYTIQFFELLKDSIRLRLRSDVPIGTCLSGGLDSSSIVCLANKLILEDKVVDPVIVGEKLKTFSSCFDNLIYDERNFIELVIKSTGAAKNYIYPKGENLIKELPKLIWHQEEPFGSTSIYAQWNVMKTAKACGVIVLLDGQGGDELLAGYPPAFFYLFSQKLKEFNFYGLLKEIKSSKLMQGRLTFKFFIKILSLVLPDIVKPIIRSIQKPWKEWVREEFRKKYFRVFDKPKIFENDLDNYLYNIFKNTMLPALLHYEDRNSMAFSLEARLPFLDYRLVEYVFSLPYQQKIECGKTKNILRNAMENILPEKVKDRRDKMGFVTPEDIWFRTILKNKIYEIINSKMFAEREFFNSNKIKEIFYNHCSGKSNESSIIWRSINLELWLETFIDKNPLSEFNVYCGDEL